MKIFLRTMLAMMAMCFLVVLLLGLFAEQSSADVKYVTGEVTQVEVQSRIQIDRNPVTQSYCYDIDVPVYGKRQNNDELSSMIIGGLLGSAVGNSLSGADGAGTAGAVAGALLGKSHSDVSSGGDVIGYRRERSCEDRTTYNSVERVIVEGYILTVDVNNESITINSPRHYDVGDSIQIKHYNNYSIN